MLCADEPQNAKTTGILTLTPSNGDFLEAAEKVGAISVQFSGHKKSRKCLFFNDLRLSFCGERGIRTPGTVIPYVSLANWWFQPLTHLT